MVKPYIIDKIIINQNIEITIKYNIKNPQDLLNEISNLVDLDKNGYIIVDKYSDVPADTTLAVIEYAAKPFFGKDTTYTVALYQAKEDASITEKMWSYKKTPASKDETLERVATVTIVTDNKTGDVLSYESEPVA